MRKYETNKGILGSSTISILTQLGFEPMTSTFWTVHSMSLRRSSQTSGTSNGQVKGKGEGFNRSKEKGNVRGDRERGMRERNKGRRRRKNVDNGSKITRAVEQRSRARKNRSRKAKRGGKRKRQKKLTSKDLRRKKTIGERRDKRTRDVEKIKGKLYQNRKSKA